MKRNQFLRNLLSAIIFLSLMTAVPSLAGVLTLPAGTKIIEEEAFLGDKSLNEVILPEGIEEIGEYAFAESSLKRINLPNSLKKIADNAFDSDADIAVTATKGSKAYDWAFDKGFISLPEAPVSLFEYRDNGDGTCTITDLNWDMLHYEFFEKDITIPSYNQYGKKVVSIGESDSKKQVYYPYFFVRKV